MGAAQPGESNVQEGAAQLSASTVGVAEVGSAQPGVSTVHEGAAQLGSSRSAGAVQWGASKVGAAPACRRTRL